MNQQAIITVESHKHLGLTFTNDLSWHERFNNIKTKAWHCISERPKLKFHLNRNSLISRTDKVELIATECFQQSCDCLGYLEQHTKSCKSYLVGKYIYIRLKNDHFYAKSGH